MSVIYVLGAQLATLCCFHLSQIQRNHTHTAGRRHISTVTWKSRPSFFLKDWRKGPFSRVRLTHSDNKTRVHHVTRAAQKPPGSAGACLSFISASSCSLAPSDPSRGATGSWNHAALPTPVQITGAIRTNQAPCTCRWTLLTCWWGLGRIWAFHVQFLLPSRRDGRADGCCEGAGVRSI